MTDDLDILAIRHVGFEDLGIFRRRLGHGNCKIRWIEAGLDDITAIDPVSPQLVVILGGPIGVYETDAYPFMKDEIAFVRARMAANRPTLGICLGAQIMAVALGGDVHPGGTKEIGWAPVDLSETGKSSVLAPLDSGLSVLHWHGDQMTLPPGCECLASTDITPVQAFSRGPNMLGLQFHLEANPREIESWLIGHAAELSQAQIDVPLLRSQTKECGAELEPVAMAILDRWLDQTGV